ncbi:MAG: glycosyltransferase family 4 protein [archaeon]
MKILLITSQFHPPRNTGSANSSSLIYKGLKKRGDEVDLLVFDEKSMAPKYEKANLREFYRKNDFLTITNELSKIKDGKYDIIHQYGGGLNFELLPLFSRNFKVTKIVTTLNGIWPACWSAYGINYDRKSKKCCRFPENLYCAMKKRKTIIKWKSFLEYFYRYFQRVCVKQYDRYFAQSEAIKHLFSKAGFNKSKFTIIPNFFDPILHKDIKDTKVKSKDKIVVLYVGVLNTHKGVHNLVKAFKNIRNQNVELQIMGDGKKRKELEKSSIKDDRIKFLGLIPYRSNEFIKKYKQADIFVHPGLWPEPFNRTILEASISKNAMIVSDVGAPPEVLKNQALIYPPHDVETLTNHLKYLIDNPKKRRKMAENVYDYVIKKYSLKSAIDKLENEYRKLISRN